MKVKFGQFSREVFIIGTGRCGSTLLQAILNQHSKLASPPEVFFYNDYIAENDKFIKIFEDCFEVSLEAILHKDNRFQRLNIEAGEVFHFLNEVGEDTRNLSNFYKALMQIFIFRKGKTGFVDGTPRNLISLKDIHRDFPNAYVVHLIRDPRDTVLSILNAKFNEELSISVEDLARGCYCDYKTGSKLGPRYFGKRYQKVYYEDIIQNTEEAIRKIIYGLNLKYEEDLLKYHLTAHQVFSDEETPWKGNVRLPIISNNFNKWKKDMANEDVVKVEIICDNFFTAGRYVKSGLENSMPCMKYRKLVLLTKIKKAKTLFIDKYQNHKWRKYLPLRILNQLLRIKL